MFLQADAMKKVSGEIFVIHWFIFVQTFKVKSLSIEARIQFLECLKLLYRKYQFIHVSLIFIPRHVLLYLDFPMDVHHHVLHIIIGFNCMLPLYDFSTRYLMVFAVFMVLMK